MFSQATVIGNLGRDPEIRTTKSGKKVASFSVASETGWGDKKETQWHKIVTFDEKLIDNVIEPYATKGTKVMVQGELKYRQYDKDGTTVYVTEIIMGFNSAFKLLSSKEGKSNGENAPATNTEDRDDEIPDFN